MQQYFYYIIASLLLMSCTRSGNHTLNSPLLASRLAAQEGVLQTVASDPERYQVQILYTQIDRNSSQVPRFTSHYFGIDPKQYFYPASTVKMPIALLALEKLNQLDISGLHAWSTMLTDSSRVSQQPRLTDSTSATGLPSVAHDLRKVFLVSDNEASNRLYEFVGQKHLNQRLQDAGLGESQISHRLSAFLSKEEDRHTNPIRFVDAQGQLLYQQAAAYSDYTFTASASPVRLGKGYMQGGTLIEEPKDFSQSNRITIAQLQEMMKAVIFPEAYPAPLFDLSEADYELLYTAMSQLPRESAYPLYDTATYYDSYCKFFMCGDRHDAMPGHVRIFNKVGMAYGYLIDNAYIIDTKAGTEFLLTAVIYVNANGIFNDDQYEYDEIGFPFLAALGNMLYEYELSRPRSTQPDLSKFTKLTYHH